jgi:hypothetical protein
VNFTDDDAARALDVLADVKRALASGDDDRAAAWIATAIADARTRTLHFVIDAEADGATFGRLGNPA